MKISKPSLSALKKILARLPNADVAIAGDLILDGYVWGKVKRISPEAPVPVVDVERMEFKLGGAANVAASVAALGAKARLIGIVGGDIYGRELTALLEKAAIPTDSIIVDVSRPTTFKTRVIAHSQQVVRYDHEVSAPPSKALDRKLSALFDEAVSGSAMAILSDYNKGVFRGAFAQSAIKSAAKNGAKTAVDPKVPNIKRFAGAYIITPNNHEAAQVVGYPIDDENDFERAGKSLSKKLRCENVLITRGKEGMSLYREGRASIHVPTIARQVFDVTGAGDTVIAVLTTAIAAGASIEDAMWLANAAAGVAVSKIGAVSVSVREIESQLREEFSLL